MVDLLVAALVFIAIVAASWALAARRRQLEHMAELHLFSGEDQ